MGTKPDTSRLLELNQRFATTAVLIAGELERLFPCGAAVEVYLSSRQKKPTLATVVIDPFTHHHDGRIWVQMDEPTARRGYAKKRVHYTRMELVQP